MTKQKHRIQKKTVKGTLKTTNTTEASLKAREKKNKNADWYKPSKNRMKEQGRKTPETVDTMIQRPAKTHFKSHRKRKALRKKLSRRPTKKRESRSRQKKVWRKGLARTETWKTGRVSTTRNKQGRFVTWRKIRHYIRKAPRKPRRKARGLISKALGQKRVAVYGNKNGKHRRWVIVGRGGQRHYEAVREAYIHTPRRQFTIIDADTMLDHEEDYIEGYWDDKPTVEPEY